MPVENLKMLHTALVDTRAAYELAFKDTDDAQVATICKEMVYLRHMDHEELHQALLEAGETPDENGSFMSMVHETIIKVRAAFTGIGKKTLPAFASGEEDILALYDKAIDEAATDPKISGILNRQRTNLIAKKDEMRRIAA